MLASHMLANPVVIDNLYVLDELQTTTQVGGGLTLGGTDPTPLTVLTGASIANICTMPLLECLGNLHVAGTLNASVTDIILAPSMEVSGAVTCAALSTHRFSVDIYVAPEGNDGSGNGTITNPFATVQRALTQVEVTQGFGPKTIHLAPGTYAGNIIINSCVSIVSQTPDCAACVGTTITGSVIVAIVRGTDDVDSNIVLFDGIHFTRRCGITYAARSCSYAFTNCFFEFDEVANGLNVTLEDGASKVAIADCHFLSFYTPNVSAVAFLLCQHVHVQDTLFELRLLNTDPFLYNGVQAVTLAGAETNTISRVAVRMHFDTVTYNPSTFLVGMLAVTSAIFQECTFAFTTSNPPVGTSFPYVVGVACGGDASAATFEKCTFDLQFPDGYAINCVTTGTTTVYTSEDNVIVPNSLDVIHDALATTSLTTF